MSEVIGAIIDDPMRIIEPRRELARATLTDRLATIEPKFGVTMELRGEPVRVLVTCFPYPHPTYQVMDFRADIPSRPHWRLSQPEMQQIWVAACKRGNLE